MDAILIAGPTASGKSRLAVRLAQRHDGVVVNADSMQVYDALSVVTARPAPADMDGIEHLLYGHRPAGQPYSTGEWLREAEGVLSNLRARGKLPVIVGGTGLYFEALLGGLATMPDIPAEIRGRRRQQLHDKGAAALHEELSHRDPATAARLSVADGQRIARALEVIDATGASITALQAEKGAPLVAPQRARRILLMPDRARLAEQIVRRFRLMVDAGAVEEVRGLIPRELDPALPVMKAIGVRELADVLAGRSDIETAIERASAATRRYAKRQMTWFRNRFGAGWESISAPDDIN